MADVGLAGDAEHDGGARGSSPFGQHPRVVQVARSLVIGQYAPASAAIVLALLALAQLPHPASSGAGQGSYSGAAQIVFVLVSLAATLPLWFANSYRVAVAVVIMMANVLSFVGFGVLTVGGMIAQLAVLYLLGRRGPQLLAAGLVVPYLGLALAASLQTGTFAVKVVPVLAVFLAPAAAWAGSARRGRAVALEHSTARQVIDTSLREHSARGERARISRELHDVVAHHISMIAVQAETARLTTTGMPADGAQRLLAIGDTARSALTEMRRLLGVLREDTRDVPPARLPQPGLAQLNELIDAAREVSGAGTRLIVSGWPGPLDPGVELAAYRIVQEALSNARRHAPGSAVDVQLEFSPTAIQVRIRDNGPGLTDGQSAGHGLLGMRERTVAVGGQFRIGSAAGGGFVVEAILPAKTEVR
jgi:signal transduction histidine kinase